MGIPTFAHPRSPSKQTDLSVPQHPHKSLMKPELESASLVDDQSAVRTKLAEFSQETTIHGCSELFSGRVWWMRLIWASFLAMSFCVLGHQTVQMVQEFNTFPTAMRTTTISLRGFPILRFCSNRAVSRDYARSAGIDSDRLLSYIISHWTYVRPLFSINNLKQELNATLERLGINSLNQLLDKLTLNTSEVFNVNEMGTSLVHVYKVRQPRYGCYEANYSEGAGMHFDEPRIYLFIKKGPMSNGMLNESLAIDYSYYLAFKDGSDSGPFLQLQPSQNYDILIRSTFTVRINSAKNPCSMPWAAQPSEKICANLCYAKVMRSCFGCHTYSGYLPTNLGKDDAKICSYWDTMIMLRQNASLASCIQSFSTRVSECRLQCIPRCQKWIHEASVIPTTALDKAAPTTVITIRLVDHMSSTQMEEYYIYSWQTLFSNLGGMVSLFCGASIISALQCLYWFCCFATANMNPPTAAQEKDSQTGGSIYEPTNSLNRETNRFRLLQRGQSERYFEQNRDKYGHTLDPKRYDSTITFYGADEFRRTSVPDGKYDSSATIRSPIDMV